jgi:hypothetical protein
MEVKPMSHFVTIKTEILDPEILKKTLSDLGFEMKEGIGIAGNQGQWESVDLAVQIDSGFRMGFKKDARDGSYQITGVSEFIHRPRTQRFIRMIRQEYAYRKVLAETRRKGFSLVHEERVKPGVIRLVLRKVA